MILQVLKGNQQTFNRVGSHFRVVDSSEVVKVTFEGGSRTQTVSLEKGMAFKPDGGFTLFRIDSEVDQQISIESTLGQVEDNRISGTVNVRIDPLSGMKSSKVTLSAVEKNVVQSDVSRYALKVKNSGADGTILIGGADVVINGWPLEIGEVLELTAAAATELYAVFGTATVAELRIFEEFSKEQAISIPADVLLTELGANIYTENNDYLQA
jgi:hypothetical protein